MRVRWTPEAADSLQAASDYTFTDSPEVSRRIARAINKAAKSLKTFPYRGRNGSVPGTRELVIDNYPYILVYKVEAETVIIVEVYHSAQNRLLM